MQVVEPQDPTVDREPGEQGELIVRGPQVFSGYWNKPDETAEVFVPVVDRIKELIITSGFNVAPTEVEDALRQHPDVAVVGILSEHSGEDVVAAVVLAPGRTLDEASIRSLASPTPVSQ